MLTPAVRLGLERWGIRGESAGNRPRVVHGSAMGAEARGGLASCRHTAYKAFLKG
jgi:hypothetical protein